MFRLRRCFSRAERPLGRAHADFYQGLLHQRPPRRRVRHQVHLRIVAGAFAFSRYLSRIVVYHSYHGGNSIISTLHNGRIDFINHREDWWYRGMKVVVRKI